MHPLVTGRTGLGVHQRRKLFELRNQYTLTDEGGEPVGTVEQVRQSPLTFLARLVSDLDVVLPVTLAVQGRDGTPAIELHKPWFRYAVTVTGGSGEVLGRIAKRIRVGKAVFTVTGPDGAELATLRAENWRARDFRLDDVAGAEVARVTKQWRGLLTESFTDADSYAVTFSAGTDDRLRFLALAAALTVDLTMKQKDRG